MSSEDESCNISPTNSDCTSDNDKLQANVKKIYLNLFYICAKSFIMYKKITRTFIEKIQKQHAHHPLQQCLRLRLIALK